jgi:hypothetical protein
MGLHLKLLLLVALAAIAINGAHAAIASQVDLAADDAGVAVWKGILTPTDAFVNFVEDDVEILEQHFELRSTTAGTTGNIDVTFRTLVQSLNGVPECWASLSMTFSLESDVDLSAASEVSMLGTQDASEYFDLEGPNCTQEGLTLGANALRGEVPLQGTVTEGVTFVGVAFGGLFDFVATPTFILPDDSDAESDTDGSSGEYGVIERDGKLFLIPPPNGPLAISRSDLPVWARDQIATVGAQAAPIGHITWIQTGDENVLLDGRPVARLGDTMVDGGTITEASNRIFINEVPVAVLGSYAISPIIHAFVPAVGGVIISNGSCAVQDPRNGLWWLCEKESYPIPVATLDEPAQKGDRVLNVDGEDFEVGDAVLIGISPETEEGARIAGKGSLVLDRPLNSDHPAGTPVVWIPDEHADAIAPLTREQEPGAAVAADIETLQEPTGGGIGLLPIVVAIATVLATAGIVVTKRRSRPTPLP